MTPGMELLVGALDAHVHACPHLNARSVSVFEAVREAAAAKMRGLVLMDNFANSSGLAELATRELGDLGVAVLGGLIMQPVAGGVSVGAVRTALGYGYGGGARFISLPTHATRAVALQEGRDAAAIARAFAVPESGELPDPLPEILDLVAAADAVFDCGEVSGREAVALAAHARKRGVARVRAHCARYTADEIGAIVAAGAYAEFSFYPLTAATQVAMTHSDEMRHHIAPVTLEMALAGIRAATPARAILSSDAGSALLPPPVEALREFLMLLRESGVADADLRAMACDNPASLFGIAAR